MDIFPEFFLHTDVLEAIFLMSTCEQLSLVVVPVRRNNTLPSSNPGIFFFSCRKENRLPVVVHMV